jgi:TonB-dependent receptor
MAYIGVFHKDVKDFFRESTVTLDAFEGFPELTSVWTVNTGTAKVTGFELGFTQFFDTLPEPWNGFGVQANYTYIDSTSKAPPETSPLDTDDTAYGRLPLEGLSDHTYNIVLMYEQYGWTSRLAWNWRSEYLLAIGPNGWNGSNAGIDWRLPVYSDSYGQLDFTLGYEINPNFSIYFEAYNISRSETRGIFKQNNAGDHTAYVNTQDTRYALSLRGTF